MAMAALSSTSMAPATASAAAAAFVTSSKPASLSFLSFSSKSPLLLSLSISTPLRLKKRFPFTPLVASQTSGSAESDAAAAAAVPAEDFDDEGFGWSDEEAEREAEAGAVTEAEPEEWDAAVDEDAEVAAVAVVDGVVAGDEPEGEEEEVGEYVEPPEDAKLFVGNLPYDMDSERLAQLFDQAGVVEVAEVIYNRETDRSRGFGFVTMRTVEEAEKAVEMFNRYDVSGRLLTVNKAAPRGARVERTPREYAPAFRVYVGNLPWQVDDARLEQVFSEHGKVVDARVVYDRETGRSRGFGFVTMATKEEVDDAIAALDGQSVDGRALRVNVAEERPRRSF